MTSLRIGSLCSGAGLLDMAVMDVLDASVAWHAQHDPDDRHQWAARILAHHWPAVPNHGDITSIDWQELRRTLMAGRPSDKKAADMYARYQEGLSLAEVAEEFGVTRQSVYGLFKTRGWEMRKRPAPKEFVEFNGRKYTLRNTGYYGATEGDRSLLHRDMWEHHHGPIPEGYDIHHLDHDKTNNTLDNFECLPKAEHARLYNMGCNGSVHKCGKDEHEEVVPNESPAIDILTAGFPRHRANPSATPANDKAPTTTVGSGPTSLKPFAYFDPDSSSWRTSRPSLFEDSAPSPIRWPRSGTTSRGRAYELPMSGPRTAASGSSSSPGLLPTPRTSDTNGAGLHGSGGPDLRTAVSLLPTPTAQAHSRNSTANRTDPKPSTNTQSQTLLDVFWTGETTDRPSNGGSGS